MKKFGPPEIFLRFFRWFCHPELRDYIEGDLMELYKERIKTLGKRKADIKFIIDILLLFRPGIIRPFSNVHFINQQEMFKNNVKIAWRNMMKRKMYSFLNVAGLTAGMTVAILIGLWINDELSFNTWHKNYSRIAQVWQGYTSQQTRSIEGSFGLQYPVAASLKNNYSQYFDHVLLAWWMSEDFTLSFSDKKFSRQGEFIEESGLEMLSLKMLSGSYQSLNDPHSIILSKSLAKAFFGDADPVNNIIRINNKVDTKVTGVYDDIPSNSHFRDIQFIAPWSLLHSLKTWINYMENDWSNSFVNVYVQLRPGVSVEEANAGIHDLYAENIPHDLYKAIEFQNPYVQVIPMSTWHLYSEIKNGKPAGGRITFVWLFGIVGAFVLLLACINFVNLTTARSERRAREVGVRKTMGSMNGQLVLQFLTESYMIILVAIAISLILLSLLRNGFNEIAEKNIALPFNNPGFWIMAMGFVLLTGLLAGLYPAFYLSSFRPVKVLKGVIRTGRFNVLSRQVLVVVQFSVSVILIIGTLAVYKQIQFAQSRPVGYSRQGLITVSMNDPVYASKLDILKTELLNQGAVTDVATSSTSMTRINMISGGYKWQGKDPNLDAEFVLCSVSPEFGKTVGWKITAGRDFSLGIAADTISSIIINETAAKYMGMKDPVGQELIDVDEFGNTISSNTIIGVARDIVMESPYQSVRPTIFYYSDNAKAQMHIRINPAMSARDALKRIKTTFDTVVPSALFDYKFVDQEYAKKFNQEERIGKLSGTFSSLAIFISCLGLFGLISFVAELRTKEIGIRKVLGATVAGIWQLLSKDFVLLVGLSCLISILPAWYILHQWLRGYSYHTEISWWIFAITIAGALMITLLTVSFQALRAALMNPVNSLRSE